jgi:hypothetical protein
MVWNQVKLFSHINDIFIHERIIAPLNCDADFCDVCACRYSFYYLLFLFYCGKNA